MMFLFKLKLKSSSKNLLTTVLISTATLMICFKILQLPAAYKVFAAK